MANGKGDEEVRFHRRTGVLNDQVGEAEELEIQLVDGRDLIKNAKPLTH